MFTVVSKSQNNFDVFNVRSNKIRLKDVDSRSDRFLCVDCMNGETEVKDGSNLLGMRVGDDLSEIKVDLKIYAKITTNTH